MRMPQTIALFAALGCAACGGQVETAKPTEPAPSAEAARNADAPIAIDAKMLASIKVEALAECDSSNVLSVAGKVQFDEDRVSRVVAPLAGEPVIHESVNSAFIGTRLEVMLRQCGVSTVIITGLQTGHCVSTTARMAANLGFKTYVVSDATATFDLTEGGPDGRRHRAEEVHAVALVELNGEFATIVDTAAVLEALTVPALSA